MKLHAPKHQLYRQHANFAEWCDYFYRSRGKALKSPSGTDPQTFIPPQPYPRYHDTKALTALREAAHKLSKYVGWVLVIMVWRDYLVPAYHQGDAQSIRKVTKELMTTIARNYPIDVGKEGADVPDDNRVIRGDDNEDDDVV